MGAFNEVVSFHGHRWQAFATGWGICRLRLFAVPCDQSVDTSRLSTGAFSRYTTAYCEACVRVVVMVSLNLPLTWGLPMPPRRIPALSATYLNDHVFIK